MINFSKSLNQIQSFHKKGVDAKCIEWLQNSVISLLSVTKNDSPKKHYFQKVFRVHAMAEHVMCIRNIIKLDIIIWYFSFVLDVLLCYEMYQYHQCYTPNPDFEHMCFPDEYDSFSFALVSTTLPKGRHLARMELHVRFPPIYESDETFSNPEIGNTTLEDESVNSDQ